MAKGTVRTTNARGKAGPAEKPSAGAAPQAAVPVAPGEPGVGPTPHGAGEGGGAQLRVRMYRQGLGDCFLVSLLRPAGRPFHMMIDCGVILGTEGAAARLRTVVADIAAETGGFVDVLVVTHEHYDHVAGFVLAKDLFAAPHEAPGDAAARKLAVGEVWFAWTEDPANPLAKQLRAERQAHLSALAAMANRMRLSGSADGDAAPYVTRALSFFGVGGDGSGLGDTAQAMANAATFAPAGQVKYHQPGATLTPPAAPELRIYVLGPPMDRASLMKTDSTTELYHLDLAELAETVRSIAGDADPGGTGADERDRSAPFDGFCSISLSGAAAGSVQGATADFLNMRYFGPAPEADLAWRRVDGAWLASSEQLALALDSATNNTSLALAIELVDSRKVLLFPADAQVGNWLSWEKLAWGEGEGRVTVADLLGRTVFYKVGHHGSHNATLKDKGLELMPKDGLVAFIPVDHDMAVKKRWGQMPLPALVDALQAHCGGKVVRIDEDLPANLQGASAGGSGGAYPTLHYDWVLPL